ncbi:MAG: hypothetical protein SF053_01240 [Bacteroidia bacterium]|nr:hypothetical protein [Bacteroidia bacterium]
METPLKFDLFIFGSTSELMQALIRDYQPWFLAHVNRLILTQRTETYPEVYKPFSPVSIQLDCANPQAFGAQLAEIATTYGTHERPMCIFPTYGVFNWNYATKNPVFAYHPDAWQINLNSRLQVIEAFRPFSNARFHLFGSLFANFPYTGDYALSMWYVNQLPRNSEYQALDLIIYNLGGMKTRFWNWESMPGNPFLYDQLPTKFLFETGFLHPENRGIYTHYPSVPARIACTLGRMGVRVL